MTRILGSSRSAIVASRRVRRPGNDGRCRRPPRSSRHHLRNERRKLSPPRRARTQARPWPAAYPRDNHSQCLIVAPRHPNPLLPLARQSRSDNHAVAAVPDSHPDCRWPLIQIAALQLLIARGEKIAYLQAVGYQDREKKTPMKVDAIFRLASMTKPIISVAAMMLVEEGKV
jgi:CubicO group peptidase (beta-lactamase class C family)